MPDNSNGISFYALFDFAETIHIYISYFLKLNISTTISRPVFSFYEWFAVDNRIFLSLEESAQCIILGIYLEYNLYTFTYTL